MGRFALLVAVVLGGCIETAIVVCGDGRACPVGTVCDNAHASCVRADQLAACDGVADYTDCTAARVEDGRCFDGVCLQAGCGNGFVEPEELCDDGNTRAGDGCSTTCASREVCGDGVVDADRAEECDDGNAISRDGCAPGCTVELSTWRAGFVNGPPARSYSGGAYDVARRELVLFGGGNAVNQALDDTWIRTAAGWSGARVSGPSARASVPMAYDHDRHRIVVFGGFDGGALRDTWEWNGAQWMRKATPVAPSARALTVLAYDGARMILFGGQQGITFLADTWAWDGSTWTQLTPPQDPGPRIKHAMVYDPVRDRLVLYGGLDPSFSSWLSDTWVFDGSDWTQITTTPPPSISEPRLVYDSDRGVIVAVGQSVANGDTVVYDLDGTTWVSRYAGSALPSTRGVTVYDPELRSVVTSAGVPDDGLTYALSTSTWTWTQLDAPPRPTANANCAMENDPGRGRVVMFGGATAGGVTDETWEWDGHIWEKRTVVSPPSARQLASAAYDLAGTGVLMFGGTAPGSPVGDTWRWNGSTWTQVSTTGPSARFAAMMATDRARRRVVLFGGEDGVTTFSDTWEWDGSQWQPMTPPVRPPARLAGRMAYDAIRQRIVLFGGASALAREGMDDTWEWDGATWTERVLATRPEARALHSMVWDPHRGRIAMFGGALADFSLWEWDGTAWSQPESDRVPSNTVVDVCATYDELRRETVAYGPITLRGSFRGETDEVCEAGVDDDGDGLAGCADPDCRLACDGCGDGACSAIETDRTCPTDCAVSTSPCGDGFCAPSEMCPGDCM